MNVVVSKIGRYIFSNKCDSDIFLCISNLVDYNSTKFLVGLKFLMEIKIKSNYALE